MPGLSVLTLAGGRAPHLHRMVDALARSRLVPDELIVARLGDALPALPGTAFPIRVLSLADHPPDAVGLALAAARNATAAAASGARLLFLDVDCMCARHTLEAVDTVLRREDAVVCPEVLYLDAPVADGWLEEDLVQRAVPHPVRVFPPDGTRVEANAGLLWSLAFGVRAATLRRIGGFDAAYRGYGAEDTDLGYAARGAGVPLLFLGGAPVFHQCHPVCDPPLQHFDDIVRNAARFRDKWGSWPMAGWLAAFSARGLIDWRPDGAVLDIRRHPDAAEIAAAWRPAGSAF